MVAADERKRLKREKAKKHIEHQRHGASLSDDNDDDDGDDEDTEDEYGDPVVLRSIPDVFQKSSDGARSSGAGLTASAVDEEDTARKRTALSPPQGAKPKVLSCYC